MSEFGMQAHPVRRTVESYFADADITERKVEDEMVRWHNKADGAEDRLKRYGDSLESATYGLIIDYLQVSQLQLPGIRHDC